jgi:hypothetical protein
MSNFAFYSHIHIQAGGTALCLDGDAGGILSGAETMLSSNNISSNSNQAATANANAAAMSGDFIKRNGNLLIPTSVVSTLRPYGLISAAPKHLVHDGLACYAVSESHWAESWF